MTVVITRNTVYVISNGMIVGNDKYCPFPESITFLSDVRVGKPFYFTTFYHPDPIRTSNVRRVEEHDGWVSGQQMIVYALLRNAIHKGRASLAYVYTQMFKRMMEGQ